MTGGRPGPPGGPPPGQPDRRRQGPGGAAARWCPARPDAAAALSRPRARRLVRASSDRRTSPATCHCSPTTSPAPSRWRARALPTSRSPNAPPSPAAGALPRAAIRSAEDAGHAVAPRAPDPVRRARPRRARPVRRVRRGLDALPRPRGGRCRAHAGGHVHVRRRHAARHGAPGERQPRSRSRSTRSPSTSGRRCSPPRTGTFYSNPGFDITGIARAVYNQLTGGIGGGSTITQQYVKVSTGQDEASLWRKYKEVVLAVKISREQTKDEILENYLNTIYLGRGAYGIQAAAKAYFNKDVEDLTVSEAAMLAGTIQSPSRWDPAKNLEDVAGALELRARRHGPAGLAQRRGARAADVPHQLVARGPQARRRPGRRPLPHLQQGGAGARRAGHHARTRSTPRASPSPPPSSRRGRPTPSTRSRSR